MATAPAQMPNARRTKPKSSGVVIPHKPKWYQRAAAWLIFAAIRAVALTLRYKWIHRPEEKGPTGPAIYCIWHNRLVLSMVAYWDFANKQSKTPGLAALVSASKDGGFLSAILECFNAEPVRGSSSRRGPQALLELTTWAERGYDLAITPDGPRGPCYVVQDGVMALAQLTGMPIVPFTYNLGWKIRIKSWDRFQIPLPFSRCEMNFGDPFYVPRDLTDAERETLRQRLEKMMRDMSRD